MKQQLFFKWLSIAAVVDWLLVRTVTRAAIHVPKSEAVIVGYTAVNQVGQMAAAFVALLALGLLLWLAWQTRAAIILPMTLVGLAGLSLLFLFVVPPAWLVVMYQLLAIMAVILMIGAGFREHWARSERKTGWWGTAAVLFPACALLAGLLVQLLPNLYALFSLSGPPPLTSFLFNLGEIFVVITVLAWWWGYGRTRSWKIWVVAAIPALLFTLSFQRDPAMTGILTIWSTGLTLFLPWPVYVLTLWLAGVTVLANWQARPSFAYAILLLIAAGYVPQLSSQLFCALIALWLLARPLPTPVKQQQIQTEKQTIKPQLITET